MRPDRIKAGFHRIGIVLTGVCLLLVLYGMSQRGAKIDLIREWDAWIAEWFFATVAAYPGARALGWIIAGFMAD